MIPKATTRRARWAAVTAMGALLSRGMQSLPIAPHGSTAVDLRAAAQPAGGGASELDQFERFVAGRTAAREALEQADPIDPQPARGGRAASATSRAPMRGAGRNAVGTRERQVRAERPVSGGQPAVDQGSSTRAARSASRSPPSRTPSQSARGRPTGGNVPAPPIDSSKGSTCRRRDPNGSRAASTRVLERRTQESQRQVQAIEADPANVATAARHTGGAHPIDQRRRPRRRAVRAAAPR